MKMDKKQKQIAIIAGAAIALYLIYRWYSNQSGSGTTSTSSGTTPSDQSAADYASLAGQEQSDAAALQGQNSTLMGQEQSDVAGLTSSLGAYGAQEQSDVSGLTGLISGLTSQVDSLTGSVGDLQNQVPAIAIGAKPVSRTSTITTHKGGSFYNYYKSVTGHAPPAHLNATNAVYQLWKAGAKASKVQHTKPHPSAPKQTHVAHPNPQHQPRPAQKPTAKPHQNPPKAHKPKKSGRHR